MFSAAVSEKNAFNGQKIPLEWFIECASSLYYDSLFYQQRDCALYFKYSGSGQVPRTSATQPRFPDSGHVQGPECACHWKWTFQHRYWKNRRIAGKSGNVVIFM